MLKDGPRLVPDIMRAGKDADLSESTLRRARKQINAQKRLVGNFHHHASYWLLEGHELPRHLLSQDALDVQESLQRAEAQWEAMRDGVASGEEAGEKGEAA